MDKIEKLRTNGSDLLVRHHREVEMAAKEAVNAAILRHKVTATPFAVSRNGEAVVIDTREYYVGGLVSILNNEEDDVYAELKKKK